MSTSSKTKTQRIEELEAEVKALRSLVESTSALLHMHFNANHVTPTTPPWIQPQPMWQWQQPTPQPMWQSTPKITCGDPAGTVGSGTVTSDIMM